MGRWLMLLLALAPSLAAGAERDHQVPWCEARDGEAEHTLPDRTRVDCLTARYAVEVDWGRKWAQGLGQALHYAAETGRGPGVLLILEDPDEIRFVVRLARTVLAHDLPVVIWTVRAWR